MRLPVPLRVVNEGLAFLIELIALAALAWWGFTTGGVVARIVLGIGAPVAAMLLWGAFAAPKARYKVALPLVLLVKTVVFASGALAFHAIGHTGTAIAFAVVALLNTALATLDRQARSSG